MFGTSKSRVRQSFFSASRGVLMLVVIAIAGPFLFGWFTQEMAIPRLESRARDKLQVNGKALDFGEQPPQATFAWTLPLTNATDRQLEVLDFELGCLCTKITPSTFTISPNETREVHVTLDLEPKDDDDLTQSVREFAATIKPIFKGGWPKQGEWQLTGRVVNPYKIEPAYVNYGDSLIQGVPFPSREIIVSSRLPLLDLDAKCDPPLADVLVEREDGKENMFVVRFTPHDTLPIGRHEFTIRIKGVDEDGSKMASAGIKVFADVVPDVTVFPSVVHLGGLRLGENGRYDVAVRSLTGEPFKMVSVDTAPVTSLQLRETQRMDGQYFYELQCRAEQLGVHIFKIHFQVIADGQLQRIPLTVVYSGISETDESKLTKEADQINVNGQKAKPLVIN